MNELLNWMLHVIQASRRYKIGTNILQKHLEQLSKATFKSIFNTTSWIQHPSSVMPASTVQGLNKLNQ